MALAIFLPYFLALVSCLNGLEAQSSSSVIDLNSSIIAGSNSSWKSPSGDFEFGFYHVSDGLYLLGIWYGKIPERTLVWYQSPLMEANSSIQLTSGGYLVLTYPNGSVSQQITNGDSASSASMQDNGNFVMKDSNLRAVWRSFDFPADTMLPEQVLQKDYKLSSKGKGDLNYSPGNFWLLMQYDGNLLLTAHQYSDPAYWYTSTKSFDNVSLSLVFNASGFLSIYSGNTNVYPLTKSTPGTAEDYYFRATIDEYGNFQQYAYHKRNQSGWKRIWRTIDDPCKVNVVCGVNVMCTSPDNETIKCDCIPGFIPLDNNDVSRGCHPIAEVNYCAESSMRSYKLEVIDDADFQFDALTDYAQETDIDYEDCKKYVMEDCSVLVATFNASTSTCIKKRMPLLNARKSSSSKGIKALIKVPININVFGTPESKKNFDVRVFLEVMLAVAATLVCLFGALAVYYHPFTRRLVRRKKSMNSSAIGINFREFTFQELHEGTDGFSKILGKGSSGKVFRGNLIIEDAEIAIAIKKLEKKIEKSENEFLTELKVIGRTHHRNLVRLLGFCIEESHRLLVYELMPNGALSSFLFGKERRPGWRQRVEIALGIARGLLYLHEECDGQIIHCDIKPENVLLDANYTAKIADFGLSKLLNKNQTRTNTDFRGTIGYIAPEWLRNATITAKVDIFSYGVLLLEIICCRRHVESSETEEESEEEDTVLSNWLLRCMISKKLEMVVRHDSEVLDDFKRFEQMVLVGLWCIHPNRSLRPSMKQVMQMLEGTMEVGIPPLLYDQMTAYEVF